MCQDPLRFLPLQDPGLASQPLRPKRSRGAGHGPTQLHERLRERPRVLGHTTWMQGGPTWAVRGVVLDTKGQVLEGPLLDTSKAWTCTLVPLFVELVTECSLEGTDVDLHKQGALQLHIQGEAWASKRTLPVGSFTGDAVDVFVALKRLSAQI